MIDYNQIINALIEHVVSVTKTDFPSYICRLVIPQHKKEQTKIHITKVSVWKPESLILTMTLTSVQVMSKPIGFIHPLDTPTEQI